MDNRARWISSRRTVPRVPSWWPTASPTMRPRPSPPSPPPSPTSSQSWSPPAMHSLPLPPPPPPPAGPREEAAAAEGVSLAVTAFSPAPPVPLAPGRTMAVASRAGAPDSRACQEASCGLQVPVDPWAGAPWTETPLVPPTSASYLETSLEKAPTKMKT